MESLAPSGMNITGGALPQYLFHERATGILLDEKAAEAAATKLLREIK
jgi:hypothetical protein